MSTVSDPSPHDEQSRSALARLRRSALASRLLSASLALATGIVLALAWWLEPAMAGHGTHTQLGLGQCTFLSLTGYPCPMCGVTTTYALLADLRPLAAAVNQPFGVLMFGLTVGVFAISTAEVVQPRARWSRLGARLAPWDPVLGIGFLGLMALGWLYKIAAMNGVW